MRGTTAKEWYNLGRAGGGEVGGANYSKNQCYAEALRLDPKVAVAWINFGNQGGGEVGGANYSKKQCYAEALRLDPKVACAWFNFGLQGGGEVGGANYSKNQCYAEALRLDPKIVYAWMNFGNEGGGEVGGANYSKKQCYAEALRLDPKNVYAWTNFGVQGGGEVGGANYSKKQCYAEALRLDPKDADAWINFGVEGDGEVGGAAEALRLDPKDAGAWINFGVEGGGEVGGANYSKNQCYARANYLKTMRKPYDIGSRVRATQDLGGGSGIVVLAGTDGRVISPDDECKRQGLVYVAWDRSVDGRSAWIKVFPEMIKLSEAVAADTTKAGRGDARDDKRVGFFEASDDLRSFTVEHLQSRARKAGANKTQIDECEHEENNKEGLIRLIEKLQDCIKTMSERLDEAIRLEQLSDVYRVFTEMAESRAKNAYEAAGLTTKAENVWKTLSEKMLERFMQEHQEKMATIRSCRDKKHICVLASCPEIGLDGKPVLSIASWLVSEVEGFKAAGDAHDRFHRLLMDEETMTKNVKEWRIAWKGKLEIFIELSRPTRDGEKSLRLYALKGGPETDWEREYLLGDFKKVHSQRNIEIVCLEDVDELLNHLEHD